MIEHLFGVFPWVIVGFCGGVLYGLHAAVRDVARMPAPNAPQPTTHAESQTVEQPDECDQPHRRVTGFGDRRD